MFLRLTQLPRLTKTLMLIGIDAFTSVISFWLAIIIRLENVPDILTQQVILSILLAAMMVPVVGVACGLYRVVLRFETPSLPARVSLVSGICGVAIGVAALVGGAKLLSSISLGILYGLLLFAMLVWSRFIARRLLGARSATTGTPIAIYGAGDAGRQLVAMFRRGHEFLPKAYLDDDPSLQERMVADLPVLNPRAKDILEQLRSREVKEILLAIPSLPSMRRREVLTFLGGLPFRVRSVPGLSEMVTGLREDLDDLREISIEDLLGRDPVSPLPGLLDKCVSGRVVLVTGGGGSIGSELCRQVLASQPARLIVLDHSEFALYEIERELRAAQARVDRNSKPHLDFVLGSVTDEVLVPALLEEFGVKTVYHAAAYKHVPIVEANPIEGFCNNVFGTWCIARAAAQAKVGHFILISSDKAVRPTNVMGATKRMAELAIQTLAERQPDTVFSMVRFGNVLGSSGSVVPHFRRQIEDGGPITLTHPEMTRYFMTIGEAVQLVIQAGAMARGGEVFVLEMGDPVKIADLALKMVHLSGRTLRDSDNPNGDIAIELIGLRPGEKLYEELLISGEVEATGHPKIWQVREDSVDGAVFEAELHNLQKMIGEGLTIVDVRRVLARWVSGYGDSAEVTTPMTVESVQDSVRQ